MLPENFLFSQTSLQDFVDCRRRFYLRYIQQIQWPAVHSEPFLENEKYILEGSLLHEAIHQFLIGIPGEYITKSSTVKGLKSGGAIWGLFSMPECLPTSR
jgi:hypothetical protein